MKRLLLLLILAFTITFSSKTEASHLKGGEITWTCQPNGQFVFTLKLYRDCNGITLGTNQNLGVLGHPTLTNIPLILISNKDLTPPGCGNSCANPNNFGGATQEFVFRSNPLTISGTPPATVTGWTFYWDNECCRNTVDNVIGGPTGGAQMVIRSHMFPYPSTGSNNTNPCYDNSPRFVVAPTSFICVGYQFTYNPVTVDNDYDSLTFGFDYPFASNGGGPPFGPMIFTAPYSVNNQMPGNPTIDPQTGEFTIFPAGNVVGNYVTCSRVNSFRCGTLIASVIREIQVSLSAGGCTGGCDGSGNNQNDPPVINPAPFQNPVTGLFTEFIDTVVVGDTVKFTLNVAEFETEVGLCTNPQQFGIDAFGAEFDSGSVAPYVNCDRPPCAYLDFSTPAGPFIWGKAVTFTWVTDCAHRAKQIGCVRYTNSFPFVIKAYDNACPAPAINYYGFTVVVEEPDTLAAPDFRCASVDDVGDVTLSWLKPWPIDSFGSFYSYEIYRSLNRNGPYTLIDSVLNYNQLSYTDVPINAQQQPYFYYMLTKCGCDSNTLSKSSDTLQTIDLNATLAGNTVSLSWNHMVQNLASNFPRHAKQKYYVERKRLSLGTWAFVDTTVTANNIQDILTVGCTDTIIYRVSVRDSSGCVSISSLDTVTTTGNPPLPPTLKCISVVPPPSVANVKLSWIIPAPADTGMDFGGYFIYRSLVGGLPPFTLVDSVLNYNTNTFTDVNIVVTQTQTRSYYVRTRDDCGKTYSISSDTLKPIILTVNQVGTNAVLTWNAPRIPPFSSYQTYKIYKENLPHGSGYTFLAATANNAPLTYNDPVTVCADSLNYYIEIDDNTVTCTMRSTYDGDSLFSAAPVIDPPNLRCLSVAANGNVTLTWIPAVNTSNYFDKYEIYHATAIGGPYTLVGTVPAKLTTSYIHTCGCGNTAPQYYYVLTKAGCDAATVQTSLASVTLATIYLTTTNTNTTSNPGIANLNWTSQPLLPSTTGGVYTTNSNYNAGSLWSSFGAGTALLTATQNIIDCAIPLQHQITVADGSGCVSQSNIAANTFTYLGNVVFNPSLRCASVLANGNVELSWVTPLSVSTNFNEYEIWRDGALYDSVSTFGQTTYTDLTVNANTASHSYYLVAQSGCTGQVNSTSANNTLATIYLTTSNTSTNTNPGIATLNWNALPLLPSATGGVYTTNSNYNAGSLWSSFGAGTALLTATQNIIDCSIPLQHQITVADNSGCVSQSNIAANTFTYLGNVVNNPDLRCLSVLANGNVELTWITPTNSSANFNEFEIWRDGALYDSVSTFGQTTYTDLTVNANTASHSYYLVAQSGCTGQVNSTSANNTLATIYLTTSNTSTNTNPGIATLNWNALPLLPSATGGVYTTNSDYNSATIVPFGAGTALLTATQNITDCNVPLQHQITVADNSGCVSQSNIAANNFTYLGNVVNNPDLRCLSVLANGNVELTWLTPTNSSANFNEFEIWRDGALYDSVSVFGQTTYTDLTVNANTASHSYYLVAQSGCTGQVNSTSANNTLATIYLTTSNTSTNTNPGIATLNWNALPLLPSATGGVYTTNSNYNAGSLWSSFGAGTALLTATQNIIDCSIPLQHQITVADNSGCVSQSNIAANTFTYLGNVVNNPDLRCLSVLANGNVELTWITPTNSSSNFNEFEIWRDGALYDSVSTFGQTTYTDLTVNANTASHSYYLVAQSGCTGQVNSTSANNTLATIYLTTSNTSTNTNPGIATLNWNALPLLPSATGGVYTTNSNYNSATIVPFGAGTALLTATQNITDCNVPLQHQITVADNSGCVSQSNIAANNFTYLGNVVNNPDLRCLSVLANGNVELTWLTPTNSSANFNEFEIWRDGALYDSVSVFGQTTYTDLTVNANTASHSYYLVAQSGCTGQVNSTSANNTLSTIYLTTSNTSTNTNPGIATLNWNALPLLGSSGNYITNSNYNIGNVWSPFGTGTTSLTANQDITDCNISLQHQITVTDNSGCVSQSNIPTNTFTYLGNIVDNPDLRCLFVQDNGNVELTWLTPTSSSDEFNEFEIWRDGVLIDSVNTFSQLTYTDLSVNAQTASHAYYLISQSGCTGQVSSTSATNTLNTIKVDVLNSNGVADISWNKLHNPDLPSASGVYEVFKEYPAGSGSWTSLGTTTNTNYQETITICSATINYRVVTSDNSGCTSQSSKDGKLFQDITKPVKPVLESVSVNPDNSGDVTITWLPSTSADAIGYKVYDHNGSYILIPSTPTGLTLNVNKPNVTSSVYNFAVTAFDSCSNESVYSIDLNTVNLTAKLDICRAAVDLKWNPYLVNGGVTSYRIYAKQNAGAYSLIATVPGAAVSYSHTTLNNNVTYRYYVEAVANIMARTGKSNSDTVFTELLTLPTFSYLKTATVKDLRQVYVEGLVDNTPGVDVSKYKLQRSATIAGPFSTVGVVNFTNLPTISFTDYTARTEESSYYYRIITVDSCGNNVLISNLGRTIFINGRPDYNLVNKLTWNDYDGWSGSIKDYALYRSVDGVWDPTPINRIGFGINDYADNVGEIYQTTGRFCYKIEGTEGAGNIYGFTELSMSNEFCLIQEPHLYVPSAFTPGGKNPVFKPSFVYINPKNYQFLIFNRWGEKIFETSDPSTGWDGTISGNTVEQGTYMYLIRMYGTNGQILEKNGRVTLLR